MPLMPPMGQGTNVAYLYCLPLRVMLYTAAGVIVLNLVYCVSAFLAGRLRMSSGHGKQPVLKKFSGAQAGGK